MNVCYILNKSVISGPNIVALSNVRLLHELGVNVSVIFLKGDDSIFEKFKCLSEIKCYFINKGIVASFFCIRRILSDNQFDVIHSHCFFPDLFNRIISFSSSTKKVTTVHNIPSEDYIIRYGMLKGRFLLLSHLLIMKGMDLNICVSNSVNHSLPKRLKKTVIYNPVRDCFGASEKKDKKFTVIYCGHFSRLKNPLSIIESLRRFDFDFKFVGLGDGETLSECKNIVKDDDRFVFAGRVDNVHDYFAVAHCLIHLSQTEGFCLSVAEALVSGMYTIVNELPIFKEMKELVSDERILFVDDRNNLYSCLSDVQKIYEKNIDSQDIKNIFSEIKSAENHIDIYHKLINDSYD
ncbi:glycosyltransferase family 4 protein [Yersinia kristensenii]|nr:glycosyltransferase family 4 protein [Yersinia kristensenii]